MKTNLRLLGSVVLLTSVGLTACDSATATNEKSATEVKTAVVTEVEKVAEAAPVEVKEQVQKAVEAVPEPAAVKEMVVAKAEEVVEVAKAEVEAPVAEAAKAVMEAPAVEVAKAEVEAPVAEAAKAVMEAPAVEAVKAEVAAPAVEVAKAEVEAPIAEAAKAVMEAPAAETVKAEVAAPAVEVAKTEVEAPVAEATTMVKPAAAPLAVADKEPEFKEGTHYVEIFPTMQTDAVGGKVEVVELMWLACPHCFALEPTIKEYKKNLPDYIDFKQVPAMLNPRWSADAKTFYIAELLDPKGEKKLVDKLFNAIHVQKRKRMASPAVVKSFIMQQGVSEAEYDNAANSMVITAKLNRARQVSADSQAQSVPSIIINGKYRTSPYMAGNEKKLMQVIDMLTKREFEKK